MTISRRTLSKLILAAFGAGALGSTAGAGNLPAPFAKPGSVRMALVRYLSTGDFFESYLAGAKEQAEALGVDLQVFDSRQDAERQAEMVDQAVARLREFGEPALIVEGVAVRPKIRKSLELLSFLLSRPQARASRQDVLTALWDGRDDDATRAYLRQAVRHLRDVLPEQVTLTSAGDSLSIHGGVASEVAELDALLLEAAQEQGARRRQLLLEPVEGALGLGAGDREGVGQGAHEQPGAGADGEQGDEPGGDERAAASVGDPAEPVEEGGHVSSLGCLKECLKEWVRASGRAAPETRRGAARGRR